MLILIGAISDHDSIKMFIASTPTYFLYEFHLAEWCWIVCATYSCYNSSENAENESHFNF
jgi:hypothetical protein